MSVIKWIQLSDLHFGDDSSFGHESRNALKAYMQSENIQKDSIDFLFVTGDIIFAKNMNKKKRLVAYREAEQFLKELFSAIWPKLDANRDLWSRIFIVPGNHDLTRNQARTACILGMLEHYQNDPQRKIDESYLDNTHNAMQEFNKFYDRMMGAQKVAISEKRKEIHYIIETEKANILHINTCISSCGDNDDGKLVVGFDLLSRAIDGIENEKPTIAIAHHNFDCLALDEQRKLELLLKKKRINLYLCGHAHARESNLILHYNQIEVINTYTCGTLMSTDERTGTADTVFFRGEMDFDKRIGNVKSYKWNLASGWHDDGNFGAVQKLSDNYRSILFDTLNPIQRLSLGIDRQEGVQSQIVSNQSAARNKAFIDMNEDAQDSLSIYGIGITSVSRQTELFEKILKNNGTVRLCMVDPTVFKSYSYGNDCSCNLKDINFCIFAPHIDRYVRNEYYDDICRSYTRLIKYKESVKVFPGSFQLRLLKSFIPLSINIINETSDAAELIIEYHMPFTSRKLLLRLNKAEHSEYFQQVQETFEKIWDIAEEPQGHDT